MKGRGGAEPTQEAPDPHAQNDGDTDLGFHGTRMATIMQEYKEAPLMTLLCILSQEMKDKRKPKKASCRKGKTAIHECLMTY